MMADTTPCDSANENCAIDWGECMICQKVTREELRCPSNASRFDAGAVYEAFAGRFQELRQLSEPNKQHFKLHNLFDQDQDTLPNITDKMLSNKGKWHHLCFVQFNSQEINRRRLRKRQLPGTLNSAALTDPEPTELVGPTVPGSSLTDFLTEGRRKSFRSASVDSRHDTDKCVLCQLHSESGEPLHNVATSDCGKKFFEMATELQLQPLLTILTYAEQGTKGVEHDMKYHKSCSTSLFNTRRSLNRSTASSQANLSISEQPAMLAARAFCNLTHYIEKKVEEREYYHTFPELSRMHLLYRKALGIDSGISEPLLKEKLATHFKDQAEWVKRDGKTNSLFFLSGLRKDALSADNSFEIIAKAAKIIRAAIFSHGPIYEFQNQQFQPGTQEGSVPHVLKALVALVLYPAAEPDDKPVDTQPTLTIAQLIFNNTKKNTVSSDKHTRKSKAQETPLSIFLPLKVYNETRSMILVKMLYDYGLGITPNRLSDVLDDIACAVCEGHRKEDLVMPQRLKKNEFTICHIDNVDVKTVSTGAQEEFHGTAISVLQSNYHNRQGIHMGPTQYPPAVTRKLELPLSYTRVLVSVLNIKNVFLSPVDPKQRHLNPPDAAIFQSALTVQKSWVQNVQDHLNGKELDKNSAVTWSAFNSAKSKNDNRYLSAAPATRTLLPVLDETFCTLSTIVHALKIVIALTKKVNPCQIAVACFDLPPFALASSAQIMDPELLGKNKLHIELGGLHVQMNVQDLHGKLVEDCGWVEILTKVGIMSPSSLLGHSNVMRTHNAITVSVCALTLLQKRAFMDTQPEGVLFSPLDFEAWRVTQLKFPNFQFWDLILRFETLILILVSGIRNRDLQLYLDALEKLVPFMFVLDNQNYARWASVYLHNMKTMSPEFRLVYKDQWSIYTTPTPFTAMHSDQHGEQMIKVWKSQGGASNVTQKPAAMLRRNLIAGDVEYMLETGMMPDGSSSDGSNEDSDEDQPAPVKKHHSHGEAAQVTFLKQVGLFLDAVGEIGNMFSDKCADLCVLETRRVMPKQVAESYLKLQQIGTDQFLKFQKDRLLDCTISINQPITRNSANLFSKIPKEATNDKATILNLKRDSTLLYRALTASKVRDLSIGDILLYENQNVPPSLGSNDGEMRKTKKSAILALLLKLAGDFVPLPPPMFVNTQVWDGAAIIHFLKIATKNIKTFYDFFLHVLNPRIEKALLNCEELSLVFDIYKPMSLKSAERNRRGAGGTSYAIVRGTPLPKDFSAFLRNDKNKENLFFLLADCIELFQYPPGKRVLVTKGNNTLISAGAGVLDGDGFLGISDHEEADTKMFLFVASAFTRGYNFVLLRSVDSDVVVVALCIFAALLAMNPAANLWIVLGTGDDVVNYHINAIFANLGPAKALALAYFTTLTGCDTTSSFVGKGKPTCFDAWESVEPRITEGIIECLTGPFQPLTVDSNAFKCIEILTICFYNKHLQPACSSVNEARSLMASKNLKLDFERLPPTQPVLLEHSNRALFQARIWVNCLNPIQNLPSPSNFGWRLSKGGTWDVLWTKAPLTCSDIEVLVSCKCKKSGGCKGGNCKCQINLLPCSDLCSCQCERD